MCTGVERQGERRGRPEEERFSKRGENSEMRGRAPFCLTKSHGLQLFLGLKQFYGLDRGVRIAKSRQVIAAERKR